MVRRGGSGSGSGSWSERGQVIRGNYTGTTRTPKAVATITHTHTHRLILILIPTPLCVRLLNAVYWPKFVLPLAIDHWTEVA